MLYAALRALVGALFRLVWRPVIEGGEHVPADGPLLVASNHLSFIDSIVIPLAVRNRRVTFLAKSEYFSGGGIVGLPRRLFFKVLGAVPIHRGDQRDSQAALDTAMQVLERGWACGIYPEGTRSRDGRLYRGRTGVAWLAVNAGAVVVPVGLVGTDRVQPIGARCPRVRQVRVRIGKSISPQDYSGAPGRVRRQLTDDVMDAIAQLSGQEPAGVFNERPPDE